MRTDSNTTIHTRLREMAAPRLAQLREGAKNHLADLSSRQAESPALRQLQEGAKLIADWSSRQAESPALRQLQEGAKLIADWSAQQAERPALRQLQAGGRALGKAAAQTAKSLTEEAERSLQDVVAKARGEWQGTEEGDAAGRGNNNYALITGASSGIGREFARQLSLEGYPLILVARRRDRLETLRTELGTECLLLPADLARREDLIRLCEDLVGRRIDIFINNAGFGVTGPFLATELMREVNMVDVNVTAQHILFKYVLHRMQGEGGGYILNVASCAGLLPAGPYMAGYYATKAYMASLTRAVAEELRQGGSPVCVGCLCPGPVDTEFNEVADVVFTLPGISVEACVDYALQKMKKKKTVIVPGRGIQAAVVAQRLLPTALTVRLISSQQKKKLASAQQEQG